MTEEHAVDHIKEGREGKSMSKQSPPAFRVQLPAKYLLILTALEAGFGLLASAAVGPLVRWLISLIGDAPGPFRLAAQLPFLWALPVLTMLGAAAGLLIALSWRRDAGTINIDEKGITIYSKTTDKFIARESIAGAAHSGKKEVVFLEQTGREIYRGRLDQEMVSGLRHGLLKHGYPALQDMDPFEAAFTTWVEGDGSQDSDTEGLLRLRRRAIADENIGAAEEAREKLCDQGIVVRDRGGRQQYRSFGG